MIAGSSEVVVGTSIASYDHDARIMVLMVRRRASAPPNLTPLTMINTISQSDSELRLPQECAKYAVVGGS